MSINQKASAKALAWWEQGLVSCELDANEWDSCSLRGVKLDSVQELELIADQNEWDEIRDMAGEEIRDRQV